MGNYTNEPNQKAQLILNLTTIEFQPYSTAACHSFQTVTHVAGFPIRFPLKEGDPLVDSVR